MDNDKNNVEINDIGSCKKFTPWIEKYRPKTMDDIVYQDEVVTVMKKCINGSDFPNLLFYGPPGTGKTSTILAAAKELFGQRYGDRVLELNASDERGIAVIREKVKRFSQNAVSEKLKTSNERGVPGFKLIILDEADSMTSAAQSALRRTMEVECKTTRFCLICNYVTRIIDPLTSRCAKFRFKTLDKEVAISRLLSIAEGERMKVSPETMFKLIELSEGDLRRSITMLQSACLLANGSSVNEEMLTEISGSIPMNCIEEFVQTTQSTSFDRVQEYTNKIISSGYSVVQFMSQLQDHILRLNIKDNVKAMLLEKLAACDEHLITGADEHLQLISMACFMMKQFSEL